MRKIIATMVLAAALAASVALAQVGGGGVTGEGTGPNTYSKYIRVAPAIFANVPACAAGIEGALATITDSTTATWGATITGTGTNHVLGYCDGTNWTVAAK